jgi:AraC family transcriptional activator of tynA and feaB
VAAATSFDLDARPTTSDEQEQGWRSAVAHRLVAMELHATDPLAPPASFRERDLGDLLITDWGTPPLDAVRSTRMAADDEDTLLLLTARDGEMDIELPDRTAVLRPGSVMLLRSRLSARIGVREWLSKRSVRVPMCAMTPFDVGSRVPDFLSVDPTQSPLSWLLLDFLSGIERQHDRLDASGVEAARTALLTLIAGIVRTSQASAGRAGDLLPVLRQQMETWIVDHLADGVIRVHDLASAFNVAPRTVHRAFAATGDTVGSVVRAHRLAAARDDLIRTTLSVAGIAYRWGFCDASHLGREFRREMSMSPGDYRDAYGIA